MKHTLLITATALTLLAAPALANTASFEQAFTDICLQSLPTMAPARDAFKANGWDEAQGAGPNEFKYAKGSTHVFLLIGQPNMQHGCTVIFNIQEGMGGGAAISFELRP